MASLKTIRKRITSIKSTQKITRAMKMVAGARLNRAQVRITELRPFAVKTQEVLARLTRASEMSMPEAAATTVEVEQEVKNAEAAAVVVDVAAPKVPLPLPRLLRVWLDEQKVKPTRVERRVLFLVLTSDRGTCGAFNANVNKRAEREWHARADAGQDVKMIVIGRKGREYLTRRGAPILEFIPGVWDKLGLETAQMVAKHILAPLVAAKDEQPVDAIYVVYNEFKSAMTQQVVVERLLPVAQKETAKAADEAQVDGVDTKPSEEFIFEPNKEALLEQLIPMYLDISVLRALYESQASELGARMTAMDNATKNAKEIIGTLTLQYNKARQAAITKELMEIIGGSEALKE